MLTALIFQVGPAETHPTGSADVRRLPLIKSLGCLRLRRQQFPTNHKAMTSADSARMRQLRSDDATWLCPTALDRARLLENSRRVSRARSITSAAIGLCLIYAAPAFG